MRNASNDFKEPQKNNSYYDLIDDFDLIEASFLKQYGIRIRQEKLKNDEFYSLLSGLMADTPLGSIIQIRSEENKDVLKSFTPEQNKIRNEWISKNAKHVDEADYDFAMEGFKNALISMSKK